MSRRWNVVVSGWKLISLDASETIRVYLAYNCVTKSLDHPADSRDFAPSAYHQFLAVKQTLAGRTFIDDRFSNGRWLTTKDKDYFQQGMDTLPHDTIKASFLM